MIMIADESIGLLPLSDGFLLTLLALIVALAAYIAAISMTLRKTISELGTFLPDWMYQRLKKLLEAYPHRDVEAWIEARRNDKLQAQDAKHRMDLHALTIMDAVLIVLGLMTMARLAVPMFVQYPDHFRWGFTLLLIGLLIGTVGVFHIKRVIAGSTGKESEAPVWRRAFLVFFVSDIIVLALVVGVCMQWIPIAPQPYFPTPAEIDAFLIGGLFFIVIAFALLHLRQWRRE